MTRVTRSLPVLAPGSVEAAFVIEGYDEVVAHDTVWDEHAHPFHELLWNERGASTAVVGARAWTITPTLGLWIPAGTPHSGSAVAGTWFRASFFGFSTTPSISGTPVAVEITPLLRLLLERLSEPGLPDHSRAATEALVLDVLAPSPRELLLHVPTSGALNDGIPGPRRARTGTLVSGSGVRIDAFTSSAPAHRGSRPAGTRLHPARLDLPEPPRRR
ncbi:AraC family ligand binding domain-containing protein [Streptomyces sp. NPDC051662]|uniref:AraC family ligand binding domain-containing protein n=1 Tax=Streptomyces sp. NPDC051662 TaxID=3154750 RepID=UPI003443E7D0